MPLIIPANSITGGYEVDNSLRFDDGSSDYLSKTASAGDRRQTTISVWVKRSTLGTSQKIYNHYNSTDSEFTFYFDSNDKFNVNSYESEHQLLLTTNRLFRDVSAWYNIICAIDTDQATDTNRAKIYVNGVQETSFSTATYPSQNADLNLNRSTSYSDQIGRRGNGSEYFDGYLAEVVLIDGLQLDPTSFGEFDEDTGIWKPISVSGLTFGTNGFYLDFEDSAALGDDVSGNGNDFTVNNLTAIDQTTDTPTNNFCTLNALLNPNGATLSEGNLKSSKSGDAHAIVQSTIPCGFPNAPSTAKFYWETKMTAADGRTVGLIKSSTPQQAPYYNSYLGSQSGGDGLIGYYLGTYVDASETNVYYKGVLEITIGTGFSSGNIMIHAYDASTGKYWQGKNGVWFTYGGGVGNPETGAYPLVTLNATDRTHDIFPAESSFDGRWSWNFGNPPYTISSGNTDGNGYGNFEYAVPSGYYSLNTKNLSEFG